MHFMKNLYLSDSKDLKAFKSGVTKSGIYSEKSEMKKIKRKWFNTKIWWWKTCTTIL